MYKKLVLPELEEETPTTLNTGPREVAKLTEPTVEKAEIITVTDTETPNAEGVLFAQVQSQAQQTPQAPAKDPPTGWKKILLDGDPISVTGITQTFQEPGNVSSGKVTAQYNNQVWPAQSGQSFQVNLLDVWNNGASNETVAFRFGASGPFRFQKTLLPNTGFIVNLVNSIWRGPTNTLLNIYVFEPSPNVTYTVMGQNQT